MNQDQLQPTLPSAPTPGGTSTLLDEPPGSERREPRVQIQGVAKSFGETVALRDVNLDASPGEIHAIVGENGSGKSTLVKLLSGVLVPDSGEITVDGSVYRSPAEAMSVGVCAVFQEVLVAEGMSVAENVLVGPGTTFGLRKISTAQAKEVGALLTRLAGLPVDPGSPIDSLSLSSRQWVTIARALIRTPKVLILDESTAALDLESATRLHEEILKLKARGCCVLLVTHRIAELVGFADRATVLRDGVAVGVLERSELTEERLLELMTGTKPRSAAAAQDREQAQVPLLEARQIRLSTEGAPIDLTLGEGTITGFAGLEGHGQAALLRVLAGVDRSVGGSVRMSRLGVETEISGLKSAVAQRVIYVSGDRRRDGILPNLSIAQNFAMPLYTRWRRLGLIRSRSLRGPLAKQVAGLSIKLGSPNHAITTLSGGNQQKVLIGRALAMEPLVLVLNDPGRGVDIGTKRDLYNRLRLLADEGAAVVYLSSEIDELVGLCDRVAVMRNGQLFSILEGEEVNVDGVLAAMFGHQPGDRELEGLIGGSE
jgi:ribose transport system ATP-binding protein